MTINERFFKLLDEKKVSQKDFCESTGIPKQTVSGWKSRKTDPPASLIPTISAYFGVTSDFLLTGKDVCSQTDLGVNDTSYTATSEILFFTFRNRKDYCSGKGC